MTHKASKSLANAGKRTVVLNDLITRAVAQNADPVALRRRVVLHNGAADALKAGDADLAHDLLNEAKAPFVPEIDAVGTLIKEVRHGRQKR